MNTFTVERREGETMTSVTLTVGQHARRAKDGREFEVLGKHRLAGYARVKIVDDVDLSPDEAIDYLIPSEIVPLDDKLAIAADALRRASIRAVTTRSELSCELMEAAESAQQRYPMGKLVAHRELGEILRRSQSITAAFLEWHDAEQDHRTASERFLQLASVSRAMAEAGV